MNYDVIVVGGGIAGLTSAAYLSKAGLKVLLCEKEKKVGGLVNSFAYKGFTFDGGIRAIENSGIVTPMLRQLGIEMEFLKNTVSIGIEDEIVKVESKASLKQYKTLLTHKFSKNSEDIEKIINEIEKIMTYMDVLYGIDNPLFLDLKEDKEYLVKTILPWMMKYMLTINKIDKLNEPVYDYLRQFTSNESLIDMIAQHFFEKTPTFFALSYFSLYLDYQYPKGGTGEFAHQLEQYILNHQGEIKTEQEICCVNPQLKKVTTTQGDTYNYEQLIWASDTKKLYESIEIKDLIDKKMKQKVLEMKELIADKKGGDSIITLYLTVDLDKSYFEPICSEHIFYTPVKKGLRDLNLNQVHIKSLDKEAILSWIENYYRFTTYEIAIPVMRDSSLAPARKTGLIISTVMDYSIVQHIFETGWYEEFKMMSKEWIIKNLNASLFPGIKANIIDGFVSTPLTINNLTGNSEGAVTGWAFTNTMIPAQSKMTKVTQSVKTMIPNVFQAGQWTFSPSGLPIAILTGKLAADQVQKVSSGNKRK